ncbi:MAG: M48 family metalloprotease [Coraliomargarita sp.]
MDFFDAQEQARKRTLWMVVLFALAVLCIALAIYGVTLGAQYYLFAENKPPKPTFGGFWQPKLLLGSLVGVGLLVSCCSAFKISQLKSGGSYVARSVGGREVDPNTQDADERKLLNVVEEMAIASGVPMPAVFIMEEEGINGFAAGFQPADAAIAITRGCIRSLTRDELQGVVAHEFSHILNGDMRMNIRLMGVLFGILVIAVIGQTILRGSAEANFWSGGSRRNKEGGGAILAIMALSAAVMAIGYIGVFFGRLIQSAISRQREFLADAAAVQFTRNPESIGGALKKIGGSSMRGRVNSPHAQECAHCFFANAVSSLGGGFATHPPLDQRIRAIEPNWDGKFVSPEVKQRKKARPPKLPKKQAKADEFMQSIGQLGAATILFAENLHKDLEAPLQQIHASSEEAGAALLALQITASAESDDEAQLATLEDAVITSVHAKVHEWLPRVRDLDLNHRFALLELALPRAVGDSPQTLQVLQHCLTELAQHDGQIELEELALLRITKNFSENRAQPHRQFKARSPQALQQPVSVLFSALAHHSGQSEDAKQAAFATGTRSFNRYLLEQPELLAASAITYTQLETALDQIAHLPLPQKKVLFAGALETILADGKVEPDELSLIRVLAACLDLPMPPLQLS